jgi:hypothetical protein
LLVVRRRRPLFSCSGKKRGQVVVVAVVVVGTGFLFLWEKRTLK